MTQSVIEKTAEAVVALKKYQKKQNEETKTQLFEDEDQKFYYLTLTAKKFLSDKKNLKPKRIQLPHPIYSKDNSSICIFTKDPQRLYKDVLQGPNSESAGLIQRVVGVAKLKGKFKPFEARRQLLGNHDIFLAEGSVVTTLPRLLGKVFYSSTKIPLSVDLSTKEKPISALRAKAEIEKILSSTFAVLNAGNTITIRVGLKEFSDKQVAENVEAVVDYFVNSIIKNGWEGIRALNVKTAKSPSLPIYLAEKVYGQDDVLNEGEAQNGAAKRKRDGPKTSKLETLLSEVVDEEELEKHFAKKTKKSRRERDNEKDQDKAEENEAGNQENGEESPKDNSSEKPKAEDPKEAKKAKSPNGPNPTK